VELGWWWWNRAQGREKGAQRPSSPSQAIFERNERESKLELFEIDPLVNSRGLKRLVKDISCIASQVMLISDLSTDSRDWFSHN
jgi:hypothetical protein